MLKLYHNDMSSCAQKVRIALAEKDLPWESIHLSLRKGETRTDEYKKLNPNGVVPTLITGDGTVIIESTVILEYLDDAYSDTPLKPDDPLARARMRLWTKQLDEGIHANLSTVSNAVAFRYQHIQGRSPEEQQAYFNGIPDPARRERVMDLVTHGVDSHFFLPAIQRFDTLFADMDTALAEGPWLTGAHYSLADIAFMPYLTRFDHLNLLGILDHRSHLRDWYGRVTALPSYAIGIGDWLNSTYLSLMAEKGAEAWPRVKAILAGK
ncbi:MAG: glutathione S-transferase family protein [Rhodospirillales bacterium]|nr:glutathione S-transferase family protein [Rhodospirillales bacterium]